MSNRRTKIICTIGPAVEEKGLLRALIERGMDVARLNFSHGNHENFRKMIREIRAIEQEVRRPIGIMADIQGPKIRIATMSHTPMNILEGEELWIGDGGSTPDAKKWVTTTLKDFAKDVGVGGHVLFDDGLVEFEVVETKPRGLRCRAINGGTLRENKGINVPSATFSVHPITEKDYADILFCLEQEVDFIAMSFVRSAQEVRHLKEFIHSRKKTTKVFAKIELKAAITHLESIIESADGILVARGDLAVEVGNERVPVLQKKIVRQSNLRGKPVIIATQMLMSMVSSPRPSRAEASDIANAILDGADALMLSNETAVGLYPLEAFEMMSRIITEMEDSELAVYRQRVLYDEWLLSPTSERAMALMQGAVRLASIVKAQMLVCITQSGSSAVLMAKCRPSTPMLAITGDIESYRRCSIIWGVNGLFMQDMAHMITQTAVFEAIGQRLLALNLVRSGDTIVVTAGLPRLEQGSTNTIKIHKV